MMNIKSLNNPTFKGGVVSYNDMTKVSSKDFYLSKQNTQNNTPQQTQDNFKNKKEQEEAKQRKVNKFGLYIAIATVLTGAGILFLFKGKKGVILDKIKQKINDAKLRETMTDAKDKVTNANYKAYKKAEQGLQKAMGVFNVANNFNSFKDILLKNLMYSSFGLKKLFPKMEAGKYLNDKISDFFVFIGKKSVNKEYKRSKGLMLPNLPEDSNIKKIANEIYDNVSVRLNKIDEVATSVYNNMSDKLSKTLNLSDFVADKEMQAKMAKQITGQNDIKFLRRQLSYSTAEKYKDAENLIMDIVNDVSFKDNETLTLLRKIKNNLKLIGTNKQKVVEEDIETLSKKFNTAQDEPSKNIAKKIEKLYSTVTDDYQGAIEKYIEEMEKNPQAYKKDAIEKTKKSLYKWVDSLDKAIKMESKDYVEKMRDLALGGAFTDVLSALGSLATLGYFLSKADNASDRESVALKYGFPALAGMGVSLYCSAKMFAGTKSLLWGGISTVVLGKIGNMLDSKIKKTESDVA